MQNRNKYSDMIVCGFALFAIFFGAGNLIFPPYLGVAAGENWAKAMFGFLLTDPVLPVLGVIATAMVGGRADDLGKRVSHKFSTLLGIVAILTIGPFFAVPRTAATTHEVAIMQLPMEIPSFVTSVVFFAITLVLTLNPGKVIDIIGKFLTPALLVILVGTIIVCIFKPIGAVRPQEDMQFFLMGFKEGYQTMDALGAALMAGIVVTDLLRKGYTNTKERFTVTFGTGIVAFVLLGVVYGGLTYVGATASGLFTPDMPRAEILVGVFAAMFGTVGKVGIGIAVALACLTTSVGLTATAGNYFSSITHNKVTYKQVVIVCIVISTALSLYGVEGLIFKAVPILSVIYPVLMVLVVLTLLNKWVKYNLTFTGAVIFTFLISIPESLNLYMLMNGHTGGAEALAGIMGMIGKLPFASAGFAFVVPAIVGGIIFTIIAAAGKVGKTIDDMDLLPEELTLEEFEAK
ncbi:MAG: branched-chain amino acid transport system II carrier protein [Anaerovoracaceae bacterium]